jgi:GT2 family glycosyltransferase
MPASARISPPMIRFSLLVPTRGRPDHLRRLLDSLVETTFRPQELEVVLGIDDDDAESRQVAHRVPHLTTTIVPRGVTMGALNTACFEASTGRFVMLLNDDVVVRTPHWDTEVGAVLAEYPDEIALVHVNDRLFRETLCTFPLMSRRACLEIGVCPRDYERYRIDDHIHETYRLLAYLGHPRIRYLEDVVFEHQNWKEPDERHGAQRFTTSDNRVYVPDQAVIDRDARRFDGSFHQRKRDALALARLIDRSRVERHERNLALKLDAVDRAADLPRLAGAPRSAPAAARQSVTVAVVTADATGPLAQQCLSRLKACTDTFDLVVFDNNRAPDFNHPREMNRAIRGAAGHLLVLMDDDILVEDGWLEGLLSGLDDSTALVAPQHVDSAGNLSFSGVYFMGDGYGTHQHLVDPLRGPRVCQSVCSATMLVDLAKVQDVLVGQHYQKYFFDLDISLRVWEMGYRVVCTPRATVTHLAGATAAAPGTVRGSRSWNRDLLVFQQEWIETGRLRRLEDGVWQQHPFLATLVAVPRQIRQLPEAAVAWDAARFEQQLRRRVGLTEPYPLMRTLLARTLHECLDGCQARGDTATAQVCRDTLGFVGETLRIQSGPAPILVDTYLGHPIFEGYDEYYAVPPHVGEVDFRWLDKPLLEKLIRASTLDELKARLDAICPPLLVGSIGTMNLVAFRGRTYGIPQSLGPVDVTNPEHLSRPGILVSDRREVLERMLRTGAPIP